MIKVYRDGQDGIEATGGFPPGSWVHVEEPDDDEIERLHTTLGVPRTFLAAALDPREVARTDTQRDFNLIVVRAPYDFGDRERAPYRTVPLAMISGAEHFVTISRHPIDFVHDLNYEYDATELHTRRANRMILAILGVVGRWFLLYLEKLDRRMDDVEDRLAESIENSEMLELLRYEKSLIYMKTGLEWNEEMVRHLQEEAQFDWTDDDRQLLKDVQIEYRQAYHMAATMQAVLSEMADAFGSLISNNLNVVMKFLAAITIVLTIPALITTIYGMNVQLPGEENPRTFTLMLSLSAVLVGVVGWWFWRQGWMSFQVGGQRRKREFSAPEEANSDDDGRNRA
ncbi:MAG: magnesium transporter CorA family protein [Candidatus Promineofilum sp.]|nr:magnesium transporter CorA family protein [Promineifilum sp.]